MKLTGVYHSKDNGGGPKCIFWPDSAIIKSGKPLFLNDDRTCGLMLGMAAVIHSVGKSITPKFATRYYSETIPVAFILPEEVCRNIGEGADPRACDVVSDYSVVTGEAFNPDGGSKELTVTLTPLYGGEEKKATVSTADCLRNLNEAISAASHTNTLKTGDITAFLMPAVHTPERNALLRVADCEGNIILETKLK